MREEGRVIRIEGETVVLETVPNKECRGCFTCGAGRPRQIRVSTDDLQGAKTGDHVTIDIPSLSMMKAYLLLYGFPMAVFVSLILVLHAVSRNPLLSFSGAVLATVCVYFLLGKYVCKIGTAPIFYYFSNLEK